MAPIAAPQKAFYLTLVNLPLGKLAYFGRCHSGRRSWENTQHPKNTLSPCTRVYYRITLLCPLPVVSCTQYSLTSHSAHIAYYLCLLICIYRNLEICSLPPFLRRDRTIEVVQNRYLSLQSFTIISQRLSFSLSAYRVTRKG